MKILVAITTSNPKTLSDTTLRWVGRMSFDCRVFAPRGKRKKFLWAVHDTNYNWYLALNANETVVTRTDATNYAKQHGYDLIIHIPDTLKEWRKGKFLKDDEMSVAFEAIGNARGEFSRSPRKRIKRFANGAVMERVK